MSKKRKVTMDDALAAGDGVILNVQAARVEELEKALQEIAEYIKELEAQRDELLEALEFFVAAAGDAIYCVEGEELQDCVDKAREAIAKAKGEE